MLKVLFFPLQIVWTKQNFLFADDRTEKFQMVL